MTVKLLSSLIFLIVEITSSRPSGSSILVASSKIIISGRRATTPAMATRCFCPPESLAGSRLAKSIIRTFSSASCTRITISSLGIPWFSRPKATSSSTVDPTNWLSGFWKTIPTI